MAGEEYRQPPPNNTPYPLTTRLILGGLSGTGSGGNDSVPPREGWIPPENQEESDPEYRYLATLGYSGPLNSKRQKYYADLIGTGSFAGTPGVKYINSSFGVVDNTGVLSSSGAFQAFAAEIANTPGAVGAVAPGVYRVSNVEFTKSINLILDGVEFIQATNNSIFRFTNTYKTPIAVTTLDTVVTADGGGSWPHARLTLASAPVGWVKGTRCKLFSFDGIPEARPGDSGDKACIGEFVTVFSVTDNVVVLTGPVIETEAAYATNVRIAELNDMYVNLTNWQSRTENAESTLWTAGHLTFTSVQNPVVQRVKIDGGCGHGIRFTDCWGGGVRGGEIRNLVNDAGTGRFGYCIYNVQSHGLVIQNLSVQNARHGYTDNSSWVVEGETNPAMFGRPRFSTIRDSNGHGMKSGVWDFHSTGEFCSVVDCSAVSSSVGFQLRGKQHRLIRPRARGCTKSIWAFVEPDYPGVMMTWGHKIYDPDVDNTSIGLMAEAIVRDGRMMVEVIGGRIAGQTSPVIGEHANIKLKRCSVEAVTFNSNQLIMINMNSGRLFLEDVDLKPWKWGTAGSAIRYIRLNDAACALQGTDIRFHQYRTGSRITTGVLGTSGQEALVEMVNVRSDAAFSNALLVNCHVDSDAVLVVGGVYDNDKF